MGLFTPKTTWSSAGPALSITHTSYLCDFFKFSARCRPGIGVSVVFVGPLEAAGGDRGERDPGKMMQEMGPPWKKMDGYKIFAIVYR
jgi:hypothetical protein